MHLMMSSVILIRLKPVFAAIVSRSCPGLLHLAFFVVLSLTLNELGLLTSAIATWVLPQGWTQPIPVTQFLAQYPWMEVDERGQMHLKPDYKAWLEQQAELRQAQQQRGAAGAGGQAAGAGAGASAGGTPANGGMIQDGGVGYLPPSALNVGAGMGTSSGLGTNNFGNGVASGIAAHV